MACQRHAHFWTSPTAFACVGCVCVCVRVCARACVGCVHASDLVSEAKARRETTHRGKLRESVFWGKLTLLQCLLRCRHRSPSHATFRGPRHSWCEQTSKRRSERRVSDRARSLAVCHNRQLGKELNGFVEKVISQNKGNLPKNHLHSFQPTNKHDHPSLELALRCVRAVGAVVIVVHTRAVAIRALMLN